MKTFLFRSLLFSTALLAAGCDLAARSPTIDVFGSYFPAWAASIFLGLIITLIVRQVLIGLRLTSHLRSAGLVYVSLMILWTMAVWLFRFES